MISALEAYKLSSKKISQGALQQLKEIEKKILTQTRYYQLEYDDRRYCYYDTDLLKAEVRVLLEKLGYKVTGVGTGYHCKYRYCIDWQAAGPKYKGPPISLSL
jgi:hypothetical protein